MIELRQLRRTFHVRGHSVHAVNGLSMMIRQGDFLALTGNSGSGKTSVLNIIGCLDSPTSGQYLLNGNDVSGLNDRERSRIRSEAIGFVFQSFYLLPALSVLENVLLPLRFSLSPPGDADARAMHLLDRVGLKDRVFHRPGELSGGQMQRVALARALIAKPSILLADEPTGNLDSSSADSVLSLIEEFHSEGQTVVIVTHSSDVAAKAKRQVRLHDGKIAYDSNE